MNEPGIGTEPFGTSIVDTQNLHRAWVDSDTLHKPYGFYADGVLRLISIGGSKWRKLN